MGTYDDTIGVFFIGLLFSVALWGFLCSQAWNYYRDYPKDPVIVKILVAVCCITETVHQVLISHTIYTQVITNFANPVMLLFIPKTLPISVPFFEIASLAGQSYFAWRIWKLSEGSRYLTGLAITLIILKLGWSIAYCARAMSIRLFPELVQKMGLFIPAYAASGVASDVYISAVMCLLLRASRTEHKRTKSILNKLIFFTTTTGALTGFTATAGLIVHLTHPNSAAFFALYFVLGRLYVNALLAALNMRVSLRRTASDFELTPAGSSSGRNARYWQSESIAIKVETTHQRSVDFSIASPKEILGSDQNYQQGQIAVFNV